MIWILAISAAIYMLNMTRAGTTYKIVRRLFVSIAIDELMIVELPTQ